ncbi:hypothetical protein VRK_16420 [Vibrio sp. MEBiC08052]|nr:hypothetical protein VRK_16420 [Vibrio sp. MEBiC08052]
MKDCIDASFVFLTTGVRAGSFFNAHSMSLYVRLVLLIKMKMILNQ